MYEGMLVLLIMHFFASFFQVFWFISLFGTFSFACLFLLTTSLLNKRKFLIYTKSFMIVGLIVGLLKFSINRIRPDGGFFSFPSGHSANAFTIAMLFYLDNKKNWFLFIPAFLIAFSRMVLGRHFLSDVIFGSLVGLTIPLIFVDEIKDKKKKVSFFGISFFGFSKEKIKLSLLITLVFLFILTLPSLSYSQERTMRIPAVLYEGNETRGTISEVSLRLIPGSGNVFVSTSPLSNIDVQASARIANQVACERTRVNCARYDFLYSLSSKYGVIGGPSAGAAMAVLTLSTLNRDDLDPSITLTGSVNLDGGIGIVGGITKKAESAKDEGFRTILVPRQERNISVEGIEILGVSDIQEVYNILIGKPVPEIKIDVDYTEFNSLMSITANNLLSEFENRLEWIEDLDIEDELTEDLFSHYEDTLKLISNNNYYSASSYSVQGIINTQKEINNFLNISSERVEMYEEILRTFEEDLEDIKYIDSLNDIEVLLVIKDRIYEANKMLQDDNMTDREAFFEARVTSIKYWFETLGYFDEGRRIRFDEDRLKYLSELKFFEARDSVMYTQIILNVLGEDLDAKLLDVIGLYESGEYMVAISKAIEIKTLSNLYLEMYGVEDTTYLFEHKKREAEKYMSISQDRNIVPLLAMSYYEYGKTLYEANNSIPGILYMSYAKEFALISQEIGGYQVEEKYLAERYVWYLITLITLVLLISYFRTKD